MSEHEFEKCDICKVKAILSRKYYRYNIKCDCCNRKKDFHFEIVKHCTDCLPYPPKRISVVLEPRPDSI